MLGRNVIGVLELEYTFKQEQLELTGANIKNDKFQSTGRFLLRCLIDGIRNKYKEIDENAIEGTNGIWQVSHFTKSY